MPVLCTAPHFRVRAALPNASDAVGIAVATDATDAGASDSARIAEQALVRANGWDIEEESALVQALVQAVMANTDWKPCVEAQSACDTSLNSVSLFLSTKPRAS